MYGVGRVDHVLMHTSHMYLLTLVLCVYMDSDHLPAPSSTLSSYIGQISSGVCESKTMTDAKKMSDAFGNALVNGAVNPDSPCGLLETATREQGAHTSACQGGCQLRLALRQCG